MTEELKQEIRGKILSIVILVMGIVGTDNKDVKDYINKVLDEVLV